jgi:hypothetical protein
MTPGNIISMAFLNKLDVIAITDHGSCRNVRAAQQIAKKLEGDGKKIPLVIPGMEMECAEGFHLIALFPDIDAANHFDEYYTGTRIKIPNRIDIFGKQLLFDENDEVYAEEEMLLSTSSLLSSQTLVSAVLSGNGVVIPAHIDRDSYSMLTSLGSIPPEFPGKILELSRNAVHADFRARHPELSDYLFVTHSDAHTLADISDPGFCYDIPVPERDVIRSEDFVFALRDLMLR